MNLPTIEMDAGEARKAFLEYRASAKKGLDRELDLVDDKRADVARRMREIDEATARTYRQLSLGKRVISLKAAFAAAAVDDAGLPKLAIARADEPRIQLYRHGTSAEMRPLRVWGRQTYRGRRRRTFDITDLPEYVGKGFWFEAIVPTIPPRLRPDSLDTYHLLWEPDWQARPPVDPALLRCLGGDLYAVVAVWDLTEVERLVLGLQS